MPSSALMVFGRAESWNSVLFVCGVGGGGGGVRVCLFVSKEEGKKLKKCYTVSKEWPIILVDFSY